MGGENVLGEANHDKVKRGSCTPPPPSALQRFHPLSICLVVLLAWSSVTFNVTPSWLVLGYTATPEVSWNSNLLSLSMCFSSSSSKFLSGLLFEVAGL